MRVTWSDDGTAAYLIDEGGNVVGRWFRDRPELSTFDPATYTYGQGYGYQGPGQGQSWMYDAWQGGGGGGDAGGYYQDPDRLAYDEGVRRWNLTHEEKVADREQLQEHFDREMAFYERELAQNLQVERERMAHETGLERLRSENRIRELEVEHRLSVEYLQLDWTERHKALDKELAQMDREMWSRERIEAATRGAQPINFPIYERWLAGLGGRADPSGLPTGAPLFQTGPGMEGAVAGGDVAGVSPYAQAYATGQRIPEFQAYGRPGATVGVSGQPWVDPHKVNLTQFLGSPLQSQELQYARWREGGLMPYTSEQRMRAAAPTGTAGQRVPSYG